MTESLPARISKIEQALAAVETPDRATTFDYIECAATILRERGDDDALGFRAARCVGLALRHLKTLKKRWVQDARATFRPSPRRACDVCGKYKSLTAAHHLTPLSMQFDRGRTEPSSAHAWLCPTHHTAVHILIRQISAQQSKPATSVCIAVIGDLSDESADGWEKLLQMAREVLR